jgi:hypothetical protein
MFCDGGQKNESDVSREEVTMQDTTTPPHHPNGNDDVE